MTGRTLTDMVGRRGPLLILVALGLAVVATSVLLVAGRQEQFPHDLHARLFPLCIGCHEGAETGDPITLYPPPASCAGCHDGVIEPLVDWTGPAPHPTNLDFTHPGHAAALQSAGEASLECGECHNPVGAERMTVVRSDPQMCLSCHAHAAADHYVDANCQTCHVAFVQSDLPPAMLGTLPVPDDHDVPGFMLQWHGEQAQANIQRCAVCHTQERCTSCHVNAADVPAIAEMPAAPGDWVLPAWTAVYPVPPSHLERGWIEDHGADASRQQCAACHTRDDCTSCHVQPVPPVIDELTPRGAVLAPGVVTQRQMPASHASRFFETQHAALAASQPESCNACHTRTFCSDCHDAPAGPSYHPRNFAAQHASAAYGRRLECSTCHEVRTFCRSCHIAQGMEAEGRLNPGFHDAEPLWLLRHARAARQGLESCTSCHTQRDCMQCHSQIGAFQVSPHGPNFDARRAQRRNPVICFACHVDDPLRGGQP
jgi:predicted CXXCH cytochrome family protein